MKFRLVWDQYNNTWGLWTEPCTSSSWDITATHRWKWPLKLRALWLADRYHRSEARDKRNVTEEFEL